MSRILARANFTRKSAGFTLIEVMVVVVIISILAAVAVPNYMDYLKRGKIADATGGLASKQTLMEQWFQDKLKYTNGPACASDTTSSKYFDFSCPTAATDTAYTLQAVGKSSMTGFTYTVTQDGTKATPNVPTGWTTSTTCWVTAKGGTC